MFLYLAVRYPRAGLKSLVRIARGNAEFCRSLGERLGEYLEAHPEVLNVLVGDEVVTAEYSFTLAMAGMHYHDRLFRGRSMSEGYEGMWGLDTVLHAT